MTHLLLMEHAQRDEDVNVDEVKSVGLNPYFNGTCLKRC